MWNKQSLLERVGALYEADAISYKQWIDWRKRVKAAVDSFNAAAEKLGDAKIQWDGMREEYVTCHLQSHVYLERLRYVGLNVLKPLGETYTVPCARCSGISWRWKEVGSGRSAGSHFDYKPCPGYLLEGAAERLLRNDYWALEIISDLDTDIRRLEQDAGLADPAIPTKSSKNSGAGAGGSATNVVQLRAPA